MRTHIFQHVSYEGIGCIKNWLKSKNYPVSFTNFYQNFQLPELSDFDFLIVMGGPMSIDDDEKYPWLKKEKMFIREAIEKNKKVLGICLGSQLIANALGSKIYKNKYKEIGWFPVQFNEEAKKHPYFNFMPDKLNVFHWHNDTFNLPENATRIAESTACKNQAFVYKKNVIALQFHSEMTPHSIKTLCEAGKNELKKDMYVQTREEILNKIDNTKINNKLLFELLNRLETNHIFR